MVYNRHSGARKKIDKKKHFDDLPEGTFTHTLICSNKQAGSHLLFILLIRCGGVQGFDKVEN